MVGDSILIQEPFHNELSATEYRNFWISWENNTITVGRG